MRGRKGFTIVEMLVVVAVLGVLVGIITTASSTSIRQARVRRTAAMRSVLEAGISTYYAQKGKWPGPKLQKWSDDGTGGSKLRADYLTEKEADVVFQTIVEETRKGNPMLDVSGLFVIQASAVSDSSKSKLHGMDYRAAVAKNRKGGSLSPSQLAYGYATKEKGEFRRYIIKYNYETDSVTVMTQNESDSPVDYRKEMSAKGRSIYWPNTPNDGV